MSLDYQGGAMVGGAHASVFELMDLHARAKSPKWDEDRLRAFRGDVISHYENWTAPAREVENLRLTVDLRPFRGDRTLASSAAVARQTDVDYWDEHTGGGAGLEFIRRTVTGPLLYSDQYLDVDPLSFEKYMGGFSPWRILDGIMQLQDVRPLVEAGILVLAPMIDVEDKGDQVDHAFEDYLRKNGFKKHLEDARASRRMDRWYLRSALLTAGVGEASLVPKFPYEWRYLTFLMDQTRPTGGAPTRVAAALMNIELPMFSGIPAKTFVNIHEQEDAFVEWRRALRVAARTIQRECTEAGFEKEAREVYLDLLVPRGEAVARTTNRSKSLRALAKDQPITVALGATFGLAAGMVASQTLSQAAVTATVSAIANSLTSISLSAIKREQLTGADAIISMIQRAR
jgi:hypothetical protein